MIQPPEALALLALLALAAPVGALSAAQDVTVLAELHSGAIEHREAPVTLELRLGRELPADLELDLDAGQAWSASVVGVSASLEAQVDLVRDTDGQPHGLVVRWLEPFLPAEEMVRRAVTVVPADAAPADGTPRQGFRFRAAEGQLDLAFGDQPVWRDVTAWDPERYTETYKPFQHLFAPDAPVLLTKGVGGTHSHHRGVFLGWGQTRAGERTVNFWHMPPSESSQRLVGYDSMRRLAGPVAARSISTVRWYTKEGEALVEDQRDVTTWRVAEGWLLDYVIELRSLAGEVQLDGDPPHAGFQFRAAQSVAENESCTYLRPKSAVDQGNDNWADCAWVAGRFPIEGQRYEVAFFDHPDNPRPTVFNTRAYGRFGAFFRATLKEGEPLVVRYRLLVRGLPGGAGPELGEGTAGG
ncbi:MAG: DUF6807 family protein, partial [Planctomycetota bacterium]